MSSVVMTPQTFQSSRGRIELVEVLRGLAALAVVMLHGANAMESPQYSGHIGFDGLFRLGFLGVDFFFVLSGFIILFVHASDVGTPAKLKRYGWRRLVRIFPTYWIIFGIFLAFNLLVQRDKADITGPLWFVPELLMLKSHLWLGVAWTLQHEMLFYILFMSLVLNRTFGLAVFGGWMGIIAGLLMVSPGHYDYTVSYLTIPNPRPLLHILLHPINLDFLFGMSIAWTARKAPHHLIWLALLYAAVFVSARLVFDWQWFGWNAAWRYPWVGTGFAAVLGGVVLLSRHIKNVPAALTFLGTISYSLYLSHLMPTGIVYATLARLGWYQHMPDVLVFALAVGASILFAGLCYHWLEKPLMQRLQKLVA